MKRPGPLFPLLRKFLLKFPIKAKNQYLIQIGGKHHVIIIKQNSDRDSQSKVVRAVSEAEEKDGQLGTGSVLMPFIAIYKNQPVACSHTMH